MPADPCARLIFGTEHLADRSRRQFFERFDPSDQRLEPLRKVVGRFELLTRVIVPPSEGSDTTLALIGAELKRRQRQRRNVRDQLPFAGGRNEIRLIAQTLWSERAGREQAELRRHRRSAGSFAAHSLEGCCACALLRVHESDARPAAFEHRMLPMWNPNAQ